MRTDPSNAQRSRRSLRLPLFCAFLFLALVALEIVVRANGEQFLALSDRFLLRVKIFERSPEDTKALFIGTSRFVDGIDQTVFSDEVERRTGNPTRVVNGATAGIGVNEVERFAEIAAERKGLHLVVVEASGPALKIPAPTRSESAEPADPAGRPVDDKFATRFEDRLQSEVASRLALVRYRKSLRPGTLLKLLVLHTANIVDPGKWSRKGAVRELFAPSASGIGEEELRPFHPKVIAPDKAPPPDDRIPPDPVYENMRRISQVLARSKVKVIWVAPPVTPAMEASESNRARNETYRRIVSEFGSSVFDYTGARLDESLYRDPSHLNGKGRALFSMLLARDLAGTFRQ